MNDKRGGKIDYNKWSWLWQSYNDHDGKNNIEGGRRRMKSMMIGQRGSWTGTGGQDPNKAFVILVVPWVHETRQTTSTMKWIYNDLRILCSEVQGTQAGRRSYCGQQEPLTRNCQIRPKLRGAKAVAKRSSQISILEVSNLGDLRGKYFKYCFHTTSSPWSSRFMSISSISCSELLRVRVELTSWGPHMQMSEAWAYPLVNDHSRHVPVGPGPWPAAESANPAPYLHGLRVSWTKPRCRVVLMPKELCPKSKPNKILSLKWSEITRTQTRKFETTDD